MSVRVYRLLRNNKEEGPFSSEELIQKNLRPYDLIWIDGRSAAWNYPGELPDFKNYAPLPTENQSTVSASVQAAIAINNLAVPVLTQKPRYRISAAWSKIQTATAVFGNAEPIAPPKKKTYPKMVEAHHTADVESKHLSWEEAWLDWEKEKKTTPAADVPKTKTPATKKVNNNAVPVLETKYTASLDDLKDKYIENIITKKQNAGKRFLRAKVSALLLPIISLIIIFSAGYWLLHTTNANTVLATAPTKIVQPQKAPDILPANTDNVKQNINTTAEPVATDYAAERKPVQTYSGNALNNKQAQPVSQHNFSKPQPEAVVAKQTVPVNEPAQNSSSIDDKPAEITNNTTATSSTVKAAEAPVEKHINTTDDYVLVPQRIQMNDGSSGIKIENISDINLDLVVIDVQYFDAAHIYRKGETLYVHHLKAGKYTIVKPPKDTNAVYATAKVSLISADAENLSVIGEN